VREKIAGQVRAISVLLLVIMNTLFWMMPLFIAGCLKLLFPLQASRKILNIAITFICTYWNSWNNALLDLTQNVQWDIEGLENLRKTDSYLIFCNHQTWIDIIILEKIFIHKIPFLKFFIKQELIWVPVLGFSWWALDFPFMKRYSKEFIAKNPHLKGEDLEATRRACEKFKSMPVSVMNFAEGTRFTRQKHKKQQSPYKHLLCPKAGGAALALDALGNQLQTILNITIYYPQGVKSIWQFFGGSVNEVVIRIEKLPITEEIRGDYFMDSEFRSRFKGWLNRLWEKKDVTLGDLSQKYETSEIVN
jgi:1-acyl-sn-glycerol-3-phosphate acyltransferase